MGLFVVEHPLAVADTPGRVSPFLSRGVLDPRHEDRAQQDYCGRRHLRRRHLGPDLHSFCVATLANRTTIGGELRLSGSHLLGPE